ncbi:MAG: hypothetical protein ACYTEU_14430 [Planctomycetota bacterium]|jgi:hypothetical protein
MMEQMEIQLETKKINTAKIGFVLSLALLAVSILLFIPSFFFIFVFVTFLMPYVLLCPLILLTFCFLIHGLIKKRNQKLAITGVFCTLAATVLLFLTLITFTPPGSMPHPLNIYKFKRACPEAAFWLDYDKEHIINFKSLSAIVLAKFGTIYYSDQPDTYNETNIIDHAENNGWKYHFKIHLTKNDFENYHSNSFSEFENLAVDCIWYIKAYTREPFAFEQDCDVLIFETGNVHGIASYILIPNDKSKMEIRFTSPALPDPAMKFWVPDQFTELEKIQFPKKEDIQ